MIELPENFTANMMTAAGDFLTNFSTLFYTIVGVLLGVVILEMIIHAIKK